MFSATVALNRNGSSLTTAICARSDAASMSRTSAPSTSSAPSVTSYRRGMSCTSVVLPEPVAPTSATVVPAGMSSDTSRSASRCEPSYRSDTSRSSTWPEPGGSAGASGAEVTHGSRSRIWYTRAPAAVARCARPSVMPNVRIGDSSMSR
jgi:hypothetical protein